jgi:hypothetical protein
MELLNWWAFNVVITALLVSVVITLVISLIALSIRPLRVNFWLVFLAVFSFSILGFVTGDILGDSRESAVGTVVPAVLTLLGGIAAAVVTAGGIRAQTAISAILVSFSLSLLVGTLFGIRQRIEYEFTLVDPTFLLQRDLATETTRKIVDIQRLQDYVIFLQLKNDYAETMKLDLSKFESVLEKKPTEEKESTAVESKNGERSKPKSEEAKTEEHKSSGTKPK